MGVLEQYSVLILQLGSRYPSRSLDRFFLSVIFRTLLRERPLYLLLCCIDLCCININLKNYLQKYPLQFTV